MFTTSCFAVGSGSSPWKACSKSLKERVNHPVSSWDVTSPLKIIISFWTGCEKLIFPQKNPNLLHLLWILVRFFLNCQRFMCFPPTANFSQPGRQSILHRFLPRCNLSSAPKVPGGAGSSFKSNWCASNNNSSSCPRCRVCRRGAFFLWKTPA